MTDEMLDDQHPTEMHRTTPPPDLVENPDWRESIGPEDADPELIDELLNEYGFNQMSEDTFETDPDAPSDMPDWTDEATYGEGEMILTDDELGELDQIDDLQDREDQADIDGLDAIDMEGMHLLDIEDDEE